MRSPILRIQLTWCPIVRLLLVLHNGFHNWVSKLLAGLSKLCKYFIKTRLHVIGSCKYHYHFISSFKSVAANSIAFFRWSVSSSSFISSPFNQVGGHFLLRLSGIGKDHHQCLMLCRIYEKILCHFLGHLILGKLVKRLPYFALHCIANLTGLHWYKKLLGD